MTSRDLSLSALFSCFIIICSQITVPVPIVPFTLQVFAILVTSLCLSRKQAVLAVVLYISMGLFGLPVFASMSGGIGSVFKPSFGFVLGFIPMALAVNTAKTHMKQKFSIFLAIGLGGILILYTVGLPYLYVILKYHLQLTMPALPRFLYLYFVSFIPTDALQITLASAISMRLNATLKKQEPMQR